MRWNGVPALDRQDIDGNNPASLSPLLIDLFPPGVEGAELRTAGDPALLLPDETQSLGRVTPKRAQEFAAGRLCSRRALENLGIAHYPLAITRDGLPRWPGPVVGSIAHTAGMCGAVVAEREQFSSIGLDLELVVGVSREIWPFICTREESAWLATLPESEQTQFAALIFSAKEAFYKCQFGVTGQWLEFHDISLDPAASDWSAGRFSLRPRQRIAFSEHSAAPFVGRFQFHEGFVFTGLSLEAR